MAKTKISSTDLLWIFRERLSSFDDQFKVAPVAIVPGSEGWQAVTSHRYRKGEPVAGRQTHQADPDGTAGGLQAGAGLGDRSMSRNLLLSFL